MQEFPRSKHHFGENNDSSVDFDDEAVPRTLNKKVVEVLGYYGLADGYNWLEIRETAAGILDLDAEDAYTVSFGADSLSSNGS